MVKTGSFYFRVTTPTFAVFMNGGTDKSRGTLEPFVYSHPILRIPATSSDSTQAIDSDTNPPVVNVGF